MIKNYKQYNESLLDKMVGPTEEEVWINTGGVVFSKTKPQNVDLFLDDVINSTTISTTPNYIEYKFTHTNTETTQDSIVKIIPTNLIFIPDIISYIILNNYLDELKERYNENLKSVLLRRIYTEYFKGFKPTGDTLKNFYVG